MVLYIDNDIEVKTLQEKFNSLYPCLQLHFIKTVQDDGKPLKKALKATPDQKLREIAPTLKPGIILINENRTVAEVLEDFYLHGVIVQVYRKSGSLWIETSLTEDWTLQRQNTEAMMIGTTNDIMTEKIRKI